MPEKSEITGADGEILVAEYPADESHQDGRRAHVFTAHSVPGFCRHGSLP